MLRGFFVVHCDVDLSVDPPKRSVLGRCTLQCERSRDAIPHGRLSIQASQMTIQSVYVNRKPAAFDFDGSLGFSADVFQKNRDLESYLQASTSLLSETQHRGGALQITVSRDLQTAAPGTKFEIFVEYSLTEPAGGVIFVGQDAAWTDDAPLSSRRWLPCLDDLGVLYSFRLSIGCPDPFVVVAAGRAIESVGSGDWRRFVFVLDRPVHVRSVGFAVARFVYRKLEISPSCIVNAFCQASHVPATTAMLGDMLTFTTSFAKDIVTVISEEVRPEAGHDVFPSSICVVFLEELQRDFAAFAGFAVMHRRLLCGDSLIEETMAGAVALCEALSTMLFRLHFSPADWPDIWIEFAVVGLFVDLFVSKIFGRNEALLRGYMLASDLAQDPDGIILCPDQFYHPAELFSQKRRNKARTVLFAAARSLGEGSMQKLMRRIFLACKKHTLKRGEVPWDRLLHTQRFLQALESIDKHSRDDNESFDSYLFDRRYLKRAALPRFTCSFVYDPKYKHVLFALKTDPGPFEGKVCVALRERHELVPHPITLTGTKTLVRRVEIISRAVRKPRGGTGSHAVPSLDGKWQSMSLFPTDLNADSEAAAAGANGTGIFAGGSGTGAGLGGGGGGGAGSGSSLSGAELEMLRQKDFPLFWVRCDPGLEWAKHAIVNQPEQMWIAQLETDMDMISQYEAVVGMSRQHGRSFAIAQSLGVALRQREMFYGVRCAAARALGKMGNTDSNARASEILLNFARLRFFSDYGSRTLHPNDFADFGEYLLSKTVVEVLSNIRDGDDQSPDDVVDVVVSMVENNDNSLNHYSDSQWLCCLIRCLANLRPRSKAGIASVHSIVRRYFHREQTIPSQRQCLRVACMAALGKIFSPFRLGPSSSEQERELLFRVIDTLLVPFSVAGNLPEVREASCKSLILLTPDLVFTVDFIIRGIKSEAGPYSRRCLMNALLSFVESPIADAAIKHWRSPRADIMEAVDIFFELLISPVADADFDFRGQAITFCSILFGRFQPPCYAAPSTLAPLFDDAIRHADDWLREASIEDAKPKKKRFKMEGQVSVTEAVRHAALARAAGETAIYPVARAFTISEDGHREPVRMQPAEPPSRLLAPHPPASVAAGAATGVGLAVPGPLSVSVKTSEAAKPATKIRIQVPAQPSPAPQPSKPFLPAASGPSSSKASAAAQLPLPAPSLVIEAVPPPSALATEAEMAGVLSKKKRLPSAVRHVADMDFSGFSMRFVLRFDFVHWVLVSLNFDCPVATEVAKRCPHLAIGDRYQSLFMIHMSKKFFRFIQDAHASTWGVESTEKRSSKFLVERLEAGGIALWASSGSHLLLNFRLDGKEPWTLAEPCYLIGAVNLTGPGAYACKAGSLSTASAVLKHVSDKIPDRHTRNFHLQPLRRIRCVSSNDEASSFEIELFPTYAGECVFDNAFPCEPGAWKSAEWMSESFSPKVDAGQEARLVSWSKHGPGLSYFVAGLSEPRPADTRPFKMTKVLDDGEVAVWKTTADHLCIGSGPSAVKPTDPKCHLTADCELVGRIVGPTSVLSTWPESAPVLVIRETVEYTITFTMQTDPQSPQVCSIRVELNSAFQCSNDLLRVFPQEGLQVIQNDVPGLLYFALNDEGRLTEYPTEFIRHAGAPGEVCLWRARESKFWHIMIIYQQGQENPGAYSFVDGEVGAVVGTVIGASSLKQLRHVKTEQFAHLHAV